MLGPIMTHPVNLIRRIIVLNDHKIGTLLQRITRDFQGRLRVGLQRAIGFSYERAQYTLSLRYAMSFPWLDDV